LSVFLQISQEIGDEERSIFEEKGVSRKFRIFVVFLENFEFSLFSSKISKFRDLVVLRKPAKYFFHNLNFF
ncbi:hypothetical protein T4A_9817, partial [Trichinella pseudospiralis]